MPVIRAKQTKNFTQISNSALRKKELSLKARGLLAYMLSFSDEWDFSVSHIVHECGESEKSVRTALSELEAAGYVRRSVIRSEKGKFIMTRYDVFETPDLRAETVSDTSAETENTERTEKHEEPKSPEKREDTETAANSVKEEMPEDAEISEKTEITLFSPRDEKPYAENPHAVNPHAVNPHAENPHAAKGGHKNTEYKRILNRRTLSEKERRRSSTFDGIVDQVSDERLRSALREYLRMRFMIKRPPTDAALKKYIARVYELYPSSPELRVRCVEQSVINSRPNASRLPYDIEFPDKRHRSSKPRNASENRLGSSFDNATTPENGAPCSTSLHSALSDSVTLSEKDTAATFSAEPPRAEPPSAENPLPLTVSDTDAPDGQPVSALPEISAFPPNKLPDDPDFCENAALCAPESSAPSPFCASEPSDLPPFCATEPSDPPAFCASEPSDPPAFCTSEHSEPPAFCAPRRSRNAESMEISWQIILADLEDGD